MSIKSVGRTVGRCSPFGEIDGDDTEVRGKRDGNGEWWLERPRDQCLAEQLPNSRALHFDDFNLCVPEDIPKRRISPRSPTQYMLTVQYSMVADAQCNVVCPLPV